MENQQMQMPAEMPQVMPPQEMSSPMPQEMAAPEGDQMAIFEQMRQQLSPQEFSKDMFAGAAEVDPVAVSELMRELEEMDPSPEELDTLNNVVDEILANPERYSEIRQKFLSQGLPEEILPEEFDASFFAGLNMAVEQLISAPSGVQAFERGGIAELKPIAKAIASYGRNGDTMLAHITPAEARLLRRRGGSGTINPITGLPEFFKKFFKKIGQAVKKFTSSSIGRLITTVAVGFFLGPAAVAAFGATAGTVAAAAITGFTASAGSSLLAGDGLKNALKQGVVGAATAGAIQGVGSAVSPGFSLTGQAPVDGAPPPTAMEALKGQYNKVFGTTPPPAMAPTGLSPAGPNPELDRMFAGDPSSVQASANTATTTELDRMFARDPSSVQASANTASKFNTTPTVTGGTPTIGDSFQTIGQGLGMGEGSASFDTVKQGLGDLFMPSSASPSDVMASQAYKDAIAGGQTAKNAFDIASKSMSPGLLRTYGPAVVAGLGATALAGGFDVKPVEESQTAKDLKVSATDRMKQEGTQRLNYLQNLPGVVYDQFGQPVSGSYNPFPIYTPPGATPPSNQTGGIQGLSGVGLPSMGSTSQPFQPYNTAGAYTNLMPPPPPKMARGGIAGLAAGGYPRRIGPISGPGTGKSDDIPAMLSDGEFVMTAAAVRGAGKGSRREGAKKMYKLMHQLEKNSERG